MPKLYQPKSGILTVKYLPDGERCSENPPRFSWMPATEVSGYTLEVSTTDAFAKADIVASASVPNNFCTLSAALPEGSYFWRYSAMQDGEVAYSDVRTFIVDEASVKTPVPAIADRFASVDAQHPRLWLQGDKLAAFQAAVKADRTHCNFDEFYDKCVLPRLGKPVVAEPLPYPNKKREVGHWRQSYMDCQEAFNHVRFLCVAAVVLEDKALEAEALEAVMTVANWDVHGTTSRHYNDESGFRMTETLAWGYDWMYNVMNEAQRDFVRGVLFTRCKEVAEHAIVASKIHYSLFDSHAVRSLSSAIMPACISLLFDQEEVAEWLNYTVDYLSVLYTPWGGTDGGWAEGGMYWTTGMAYLISALDLLKNFSGIDLFKRPFFQATGSFPMYCFPHDTYRASFCDQSNLGDKPALKTGFNAREFAGVTGNGEYQWYFEEIAKREDYEDTRFFNIGWWNFRFDEMQYLANYTAVPATAPKSGRNVKWFKDIGWVALHSNMDKPEEHIFMLTKSSPYGSVSHSHGDQNAILLHAFEEPLLIESGYYVGFNTSMHRQWRKKTCSKNTLLINGQGQYDDLDKTIQLKATGNVQSVIETENCVQVIENATEAYKVALPGLKDYTREIRFVDDTYFILIDTVEMEEECSVDFLQHSLFEPKFDKNQVKIKGEKAELTSEFIYVSSGIERTEITQGFPNVNPAEFEGQPESWNFALHTGTAKKHMLITCLHPKKANDKKTIEVIADDQGHDFYFYFTNDGETYTLCISGDKRY